MVFYKGIHMVKICVPAKESNYVHNVRHGLHARFEILTAKLQKIQSSGTLHGVAWQTVTDVSKYRISRLGLFGAEGEGITFLGNVAKYLLVDTFYTPE
jgi:hypothetical protein